MSKGNYTVEPLSQKLIDYLAKNDKFFEQTDIDVLPSDLKIKIDDSKKKLNTQFVNHVFTDFEKFHTKLHNSKKKFIFNKNDKIYFMYKLRDDPDLVVNSGYTKYSFKLIINNDTGDLYGGDSLYTLTIIDTETGETGVYETTVGRFD
jgi:hypothetical protein